MASAPIHCPECAASGVAIPSNCRHGSAFNLPVGSIVGDTDCECILRFTEDGPYQQGSVLWYRRAEIVSLCSNLAIHGKFKHQGLIDGYPPRRIKLIDPLTAEFIAIDLKGGP